MDRDNRWRDDNYLLLALHLGLRAFLLVLPTLLLLGAGLRATSAHRWMLWLGTFFQCLVCFLSFISRRSWVQSIAPQIITLYLIALCWLWLGSPVNDWYVAMSKAILILVPLFAFAYQTLHESGAPAIRRARLLADRLANRKEWPDSLEAIRSLPEVRAFRSALHIDAAPALALLTHPNVSVRVAALVALEFRKEWKPGQAEHVLQLAHRAEQPIVRAAAVAALAGIEDRLLIERLATFLHDPSREVRQAATEALLWDTEKRWGWIRFAVRRALADPLFQHDGPLIHEGMQLTREAIDDLLAWTAEKGILPQRAAATLGSYYNRLLEETGNPQLIKELRQRVADYASPPPLRIELARVLAHHGELDAAVLERIVGAANPTPLRLIGVGTILEQHSDGILFDMAETALRDLARLPNREIALSVASLVQRKLGVDLGLGPAANVPAPHTPQAAEITHRLMQWAASQDDDEIMDSRPVTIRRA